MFRFGASEAASAGGSGYRPQKNPASSCVHAADENLLQPTRSGSSSPVPTHRRLQVRQSEPASLMAQATSSPLSATATAESAVVPCSLKVFGSRTTAPTASGLSAVQRTS